MIPLLLASLQSDLDARVDATLAKLTLEEKVSLIGGYRGFNVRPIERLGLKELVMSDGPMGIRNYGKTAAYPAGANLAATWNPDLATRFGESMARDARARGVHIWLGPGVNLARVPQNGRNFEYYGEDPILAGRMAVSAIRAAQANGLVATIKHFAGNEHEFDRNRDNSVIDERTLRELYLRPFEMGVKEGGVWAVMCSYNLLNGTYTSENGWLQNKVLRDDWGFRGVEMSDWGAVHSTKPALMNGMDLEMPGPEHFNPAKVLPLVRNGEVPEATIDEKVRRILRMGYAMGFHDRPQKADIPLEDPKSAEVALEMARQGVVLLRNERRMLPLNRTWTRKIVVFGPNAENGTPGGGGSAYTEPFRYLNLVEAIRKVGGPAVKVVQVPFLRERDAFRYDGYVGGLKAEYWDNQELKGAPVITRTERRIDNAWNATGPEGLPADRFSARWTGKISPDRTGDYLLVARSDDGVRVFLDGKAVINAWGEHGAQTDTGTVRLQKGRTYDLRVEYFESAGEAVMQFGLIPLAQALNMDDLKDADAVIANVGFAAATESEGFDRTFALPASQETLVRELAGRTKKLVVINNSGAGIDMSAWVDRTAALVQAWYPGQNGNQAVAEVLFGVTNPSGKLPTTFPRTLKGTYYETAFPPVKNEVVYREGLLMGYRWFDAKNRAPLFPFGFGLSYTTFALSDLRLGQGAGNVVARAKVRNTGSVAGWETVQAYVGRDGRPADRPVRELKAFGKVWLRPGETKEVTLTIPRDSLREWEKGWRLVPGTYTVSVGTSSRSLPLQASVRL